MKIPALFTLWRYVGPGRPHGTYFSLVFAEPHEIVAVQCHGENTITHLPIAPDYSWLGTVMDFYAKFQRANV